MHLEKCFCRKRVRERKERYSVRVNFFPEIECGVIGVLVSEHGPDLLCFKDNEYLHATTQCSSAPYPHEPFAVRDHHIISLRGTRDFEMYAYCAMVPEGLMPCFCARCTCIGRSARNAQAKEVERTLLVPESFPLPGRSFFARTSWPTIRS